MEPQKEAEKPGVEDPVEVPETTTTTTQPPPTTTTTRPKPQGRDCSSLRDDYHQATESWDSWDADRSAILAKKAAWLACERRSGG